MLPQTTQHLWSSTTWFGITDHCLNRLVLTTLFIPGAASFVCFHGIIFFVVSTVVFVVFVQFDAEFRRFSVSRQTTLRFDDFYRLVEEVHCLQSVPFIITYTDPEGDLLPINNDDNFAVAFSSAQPVLRLHIQQKGVMTYVINDLLFLHITDNSSWFLVQKKLYVFIFSFLKIIFLILTIFLCCCETTL